MEKIVLNDSDLAKNPSNKTIKAFETFILLFGSFCIGKAKPISVNWLEDLGFTSDNLKEHRLMKMIRFS